MELADYLPVINGTLPIYLNQYGYFTVDEAWHVPILKLALLHHWDRFAKVVGRRQLWSIYTDINNKDRLYFNPDGTPWNAPMGVTRLVAREKELSVIRHLREHSIDWWAILLGVAIVVLLYQLKFVVANLKALLQRALTTDALQNN